MLSSQENKECLGMRVVHYEAECPANVLELVGRLFPAYQVDGGRVYLAGCRWEDRPFFCFRREQEGRAEEIWTNDHFQPLSPQQLHQLALHPAHRIPAPPPYAPAGVANILQQAQQWAEALFVPNGYLGETEIAAVWCRFVEGKLRFTIGSASADLSFSGWASSLTPPPFLCPSTGRATFHLAATDDGRILDASAVGRCELTGRRLPVDELVRCSWTGKVVDKSLIYFCSISGQPILRTELRPCTVCQQKVSPAFLQQAVCSACRALHPVCKADPRMARILAEYPTLDRWYRWQLAETRAVYIAVASGLWKKLLLVVDKETLELRHLATGHRLQTHWRPVEPRQYCFALRE